MLTQEVVTIAKTVADWTQQAGSMLPKTSEDIAAYITDGRAVVLTNTQGALVAFGAISYSWPGNWQELGAIVVNPQHRRQGWGHRAVQALVDLSKTKYPADHLFALCNPMSLPLFLSAGGEVITDPSMLPAEVWGACVNCPMLAHAQMHSQLCCDTPVLIK